MLLITVGAYNCNYPYFSPMVRAVPCFAGLAHTYTFIIVRAYIRREGMSVWNLVDIGVSHWFVSSSTI